MSWWDFFGPNVSECTDEKRCIAGYCAICDHPSPPPQSALDRIAADADESERRGVEWRERALRAEEEERALRLEVAALKEAQGELLEVRDENVRLLEWVRGAGHQTWRCTYFNTDTGRLVYGCLCDHPTDRLHEGQQWIPPRAERVRP